MRHTRRTSGTSGKAILRKTLRFWQSLSKEALQLHCENFNLVSSGPKKKLAETIFLYCKNTALGRKKMLVIRDDEEEGEEDQDEDEKRMKTQTGMR